MRKVNEKVLVAVAIIVAVALVAGWLWTIWEPLASAVAIVGILAAFWVATRS